MEEQIAQLEQAVAELQQKVAQFDAVAFAEEVRYELVLWKEQTEGMIRNLELQLLDTIKRIDGLDALLQKADELLKKLEGIDLEGLDPEKIKQAVLAELAGWRSQTDGRLDSLETRVTKLETDIQNLSPENIVIQVLESIKDWRNQVDADLATLKTGLDKLSKDLLTLKSELDAFISKVKQQIMDLQETDRVHDQRLDKVESDLVRLAERIEEVARIIIDPALIQAEIEKLINTWKITVEQRLNDLEGLNALVAALKKQLDELPPILSAAEIRQMIAAELALLEGKLTAEINALKSDLNSLTARVAILEGTIGPDINQIVILVIKELETWQKQIEQRLSVLEAQRVVDRQDIDKLIQGLSDLLAKVNALVILTQSDVISLIQVQMAPWIAKIETVQQLVLTLEANTASNSLDITALKTALEGILQTLAGPLPPNWEAQVKQIIEALLLSIKADITQLKLDKTTLEATLALLNTMVIGLQAELAALAIKVNNLPVPLTEAQINALIGLQIAALKTELEAKIAALDVRILALEDWQAQINQVIVQIQASISAQDTKIELLHQLILEIKVALEALPHIHSAAEIIELVTQTIADWKQEIETKIEQLQVCCEEGKGKITAIEAEIVEIKKILNESDASAIGIRLARRCLTGWGIVGGLEIKSDDACAIHLSKGTGITPRGVLLHACDPLYFTHYRKFDHPADDPVFKNYPLWELLVWESLGIEPGDPIPDGIHPLTPQTGSEPPFIEGKAVIVLPGQSAHYYLLIKIDDLVALNGKTADLHNCMGGTGFDPDMGFSESFSPLDALPTDNDLYMAFNPVMVLPEIPLFRFGFRPPDECDPEELDDPNFPMICDLDKMYETWLPIIQDAFKQIDRWVKMVMVQYHDLLFPQLEKDVFEAKLELLFEKWASFTHYNQHALPNKTRKFYVQYFYDWARDLIAAYHELRSELQVLMAELCVCRPDLLLEQRPFLMLGLAVRPDQDGLAAPLRDAFHQSPIFNGNFIRLETCRLYYRRQFEMIEGFYLPGYQDDLTLPCWCHHHDEGWEPDFDRLRITPGKSYIYPLSRQSLPFYYPLAPNMESLHFYWEYRRAKMRQADYHLSYHASDADDSYSHRPEVIRPLFYSFDPYDFFRIEGFIGKSIVPLSDTAGAAPVDAIRYMVQKYNLDFEVVELDIYCNECRFLTQKYPHPDMTVKEFVTSFRQDILGAEHWAGVPRGGTFIIVTTKIVLDDVSQKVAIADFMVPYRCCPPKPVLCKFDLAVKMAANCRDGKRDLQVTVTPSNLTSGKFTLTLDGNPIVGSVGGVIPRDAYYTYNNGQPITIDITAPADDQLHAIQVKDNDRECCGESSLVIPGCACKILVTATPAKTCIRGKVKVDITIATTNRPSGGYYVKLDGQDYPIGAPLGYVYDSDGITTLSIELPGDGKGHQITILDSEDSKCTGTAKFVVPDCAPDISVAAIPSDVCLEQGLTSVEVIVTVKNPKEGRFRIEYNNQEISPVAGSQSYHPSGANVLSIEVPGDGKKHKLKIIDAQEESLNASTEVKVKDCKDIFVPNPNVANKTVRKLKK